MDIYYTLQSLRGVRNRLRLHRAYYFLDTSSLKAKKIPAVKDRQIEEKGPPMRSIECVAHATQSDTGGPRDAVEGRAVGAVGQAGSCDRIRSRTAYFLRRAGVAAPLFSAHRSHPAAPPGFL